MKKSIVSLVTAAAIYGTFSFGASTSAKEVIIEKGDTLWGIAKANDILVEDLKEWNGLTSDIIYPEDRLKVALTEEYLIERGDTLSEIATQYEGISYHALQEWNQIKDADFILAGDTLTVYLKGNPQQRSTQRTSTNEAQPESTSVNETANVNENTVNLNKEIATAQDKKAEEPVSQEQEPAQEAAAEVDEPVKEEEEAPSNTIPQKMV